MSKYLKVAITAGSLLACVLMIGLWVRSYYRLDTFRIPLLHPETIEIGSMRGKFDWNIRNEPGLHNWDWVVSTVSDRDWSEYDAEVRAWHWVRILNVVGLWFGVKFLIFFVFFAPHCFFAPLPATIAALPWVKWRQFSLRTLLIVMTLIAVFFGMIAMSI